MKTRLFTLFAAAFLGTVLFVLTGCDSLTGPDENDSGCIPGTGLSKADCTSPAPGDEFNVRIVPEGGTASLRFVATGVVEDKGRVEGNISSVNLEGSSPVSLKGVRALRGSKGILVLSFEGQAISEDRHSLVGTFKILDNCTEAYAGFKGEGTFRVNYDSNGVRTEELFSGKILRPES